MKFLSWLYLSIYTLFWLLGLVLSFLTDEDSLALIIQTAVILIPSYVLLCDLLKKENHIGFSVLGLMALIYLLAGAHNYSSFSVVTPFMYILYSPMALYLSFNLYKRYNENT